MPRQRKLKRTEPIQYEVIATGSSGNSVVIDQWMFDLGLPYRKLSKYFSEITHVFITHIHSDHLNAKTYNEMRKLHPKIKTIGNYEVHQQVGVDIISNHNRPIKLDNIIVTPFRCRHDVEVQGFVWQKNGANIIFATDTFTLKHAPREMKYDYLFLESNHDETKLELVRAQVKGRYSPFISAKRHLSSQQCREFYYFNRRDKGSKLIELHMSSRFY